MRLTGRQIDHLRHLADGTPHRPVGGATRRSCYLKLVARGLAKIEPLQGRPMYVITDLGRAALAQSEEKS